MFPSLILGVHSDFKKPRKNWNCGMTLPTSILGFGAAPSLDVSPLAQWHWWRMKIHSSLATKVRATVHSGAPVLAATAPVTLCGFVKISRCHHQKTPTKWSFLQCVFTLCLHLARSKDLVKKQQLYKLVT